MPIIQDLRTTHASASVKPPGDGLTLRDPPGWCFPTGMPRRWPGCLGRPAGWRTGPSSPPAGRRWRSERHRPAGPAPRPAAGPPPSPPGPAGGGTLVGSPHLGSSLYLSFLVDLYLRLGRSGHPSPLRLRLGLRAIQTQLSRFKH